MDIYPNRLIQQKSRGSLVPGEFPDDLYIYAYNIESSMLDAGSKPNEDYRRLDIFKLAMQMFTAEFREKTKQCIIDGEARPFEIDIPVR